MVTSLKMEKYNILGLIMNALKSKLEESYERHLSLPLPGNAVSDELAEAIDQMKELDAFIVGCVTSFLETQTLSQALNPDGLKKLREYLNSISILSNSDSRVRQTADLYLKSLEQMGMLLSGLTHTD